jgi:hypothetical protein
MYWLRSLFKVKSLSDLELLIRIYSEVSGELTVTDSNKNKIKDVEWCKNPFEQLLGMEFPYKITSRLVGPQSLLGIAPKLKKNQPICYSDVDRSVLLKEWSDHIDTVLLSEMNRKNDLGRMTSHPKSLLSMTELIIAARLSKHATHVYMGESGAIISNFQCVYLSWFPIESDIDIDESASLMFDKDDGLNSPFEDTDKTYNYMRRCFKFWKKNNYIGKLSDYCTEYLEHFD